LHMTRKGGDHPQRLWLIADLRMALPYARDHHHVVKATTVMRLAEHKTNLRATVTVDVLQRTYTGSIVRQTAATGAVKLKVVEVKLALPMDIAELAAELVIEAEML